MSSDLAPAAARDRALRRIRVFTWGTLAAVAGLSGAFSTAAALTFSGKAVPAAPPPPPVPAEAAPLQHAPPAPIVVKHVVHRAATTAWAPSGSGPAAPGQAPQAAPPPPPPPACVSTPSHPC